MSMTTSCVATGATRSRKPSMVGRIALALSSLILALAFLVGTPVSSTEVSAATASSKSQSASKKKYRKYYSKRAKKRRAAYKRKYYKKRKYYNKRKYKRAKRKAKRYTKRRYAKRRYAKRKKYSKRRYAKRKYSKRKYAKRKYAKRSYKKRKYSSKKRSKKRYAKARKRPKIGWKGGRYGYANKKKKSKGVRVAALGKTAYPSATKKRKSLTGGGVRWVASSKCLNSRLRALMYEVAANYGSVTVSSTCRSRSRNARVGGARRSQHLTGSAVDFRVHGRWGAAWAFIKRAGGVGGYKHYGGGLFHVDTGPRRTW